MADMRSKAIVESDARWPDYGDPASHALSGGFIDGAIWADQCPDGDLEVELNRRFPKLEDPIEQLVSDRWRQGFWLGAAWVIAERDSQPADSASTSLQVASPLYLAMIFNPPLAEGIEAEAVIHSDLNSLKAMVGATVDEANLDGPAEDLSFSWDDLTYYPEGEPVYGHFAWARIQEATPGVRLRFSEFG